MRECGSRAKGRGKLRTGMARFRRRYSRDCARIGPGGRGSPGCPRCRQGAGRSREPEPQDETRPHGGHRPARGRPKRFAGVTGRRRPRTRSRRDRGSSFVIRHSAVLRQANPCGMTCAPAGAGLFQENSGEAIVALSWSRRSATASPGLPPYRGSCRRRVPRTSPSRAWHRGLQGDDQGHCGRL